MKQIERGGKNATRLFSNFRRCYLRLRYVDLRQSGGERGVLRKGRRREKSGVSAISIFNDACTAVLLVPG